MAHYPHYHQTLFGRSYEDWYHFNNLLRDAGIETPLELARRLKVGNEEYEVRDSRNHDRLLGTISLHRKFSEGCEVVSVAARPTFDPIYAPFADTPSNSPIFETARLTRASGKFGACYFVTADPLSVLKRVRGFRLP